MKIFIIIFISILVFACSDNNSSDSTKIEEFRKIIYATDSDNSELYVYDVEINSSTRLDIFNDANKTPVPGKIESIYHYGSNYYLTVPDANQIIIIDINDYRIVDIINFNDYEPFRMTFAINATTAYVIHKNADVVSVIDLTVNEVATEITSDISQPKDIAADGNVLFVANFGDNSVSMFSTMNEELLNKFDVSPRPVSVNVLNADRSLYVLSAGYGKFSDEAQKSPAIATFIDPNSGNVISSFNVGYASLTPESVIPYKTINSINDYLFLLEENNILFINGRTKKDSRLFYFKKFSDLYYDIFDDKLYIAESLTNRASILVFSTTSSSINEQFDIAHTISAFVVRK